LPVGANVGCEDRLDDFSAGEVGTDVDVDVDVNVDLEVDATTRVADDESAWLTE
jgi:hypothetical protein